MVGVSATHMDKVTDGTTDGITDGVGTIRMAGTTAGDMAMILTDMATTLTAGTMVGTTTLGLRQAEIAPEQEQPAQQRPVLQLELTTATVGRQNTRLPAVLE